MIGNAYGTNAGLELPDLQPGRAYFDQSGKKYVFAAATMPQYQQMVTLLNGWYNRGLIDPESFNQPDTQAQAKLTSEASRSRSWRTRSRSRSTRKAMPKSFLSQTVGKIPVPLGPVGATVVGSRLDSQAC